ncbi:MAG TPA: CHAD domain-containing protein, partial [Kiritimatiellia bacterium]
SASFALKSFRTCAVPDAARRLLAAELRLLRRHTAGAAEGVDPDQLHEFRNALRRSRILLRVFRKHLAGPAADALRRRMRRLQRATGPARDMDVWLSLLDDPERMAAAREDPRWAPFHRGQKQARARIQASVRRAVGAAGPAVVASLTRIVRSGTRPPGTGERMDDFAARRLARDLRAAWKLRKFARSHKPSELHRLRRALRRVRHLLDLFAAVHPRSVVAACEPMRKAERALGKVHDLDLALARLHASRVRRPDGLKAAIRHLRRRELKRFRRNWNRFKHARSKPRRETRAAARSRPQAH